MHFLSVGAFSRMSGRSGAHRDSDQLCRITEHAASPSPENSTSQWKHKLFQLQESAPKPKIVHSAQRNSIQRPSQYGDEYHGLISREETDRVLRASGEGSYLVRESSRAPGAYTLCFLFDSQTRNYKLFYDGKQHYVGEKKFDSVHDLVADGLITLYVENNAAEYIRDMADETVYEESPYSHYLRAQRRTRQTATKSRNHSNAVVNSLSPSLLLSTGDDSFLRNVSRSSDRSTGSGGSTSVDGTDLPMKAHRFQVRI